MNYEIVDIDALGRIGTITVNNKQMVTPNLFPVVHPYKNIISIPDLKKFGAQCIFTNAYFLYHNKARREEALQKGIHEYLNFDGIIATDSGAFQQYMYQNSKIEIKAEEIEQFQEKINSDFPVILDIPVQLKDDYKSAQEKVNITLERAKENINRRTNVNCNWFGPIHGARYDDLLRLSAGEMNKLDYSVYAIGGLVKAFLDYRFDLIIDILLTVKEILSPNKPLHMFGLGLPQFFSLAVACGCDLMDSAAYILYAKENRYFSLSTGTKNLNELVEFPCHCPICNDYTPKEMNNLDEKIRIELLAKHNLHLSFSELRTIRQAIREGNLWELVEQRIRAHPNLVSAAKRLKKYISTFETHEKIYKRHGRMYGSSESIRRPLIMRYENRMKNNYRIPSDAKYLIILPELDTRVQNSPTIKTWLEDIDNNTFLPRKLLHIVFNSNIFGMIPLELINTFPMGQFESAPPTEMSDILYKKSKKKSAQFIEKFSKYYRRCGVLIPELIINQFNETIKFNTNNSIYGLEKILRPQFHENLSIFNKLEGLLHFLKEDLN
jgi:7-cyano-7-deazaguanine tRNA-ribosyltransferase